MGIASAGKESKPRHASATKYDQPEVTAATADNAFEEPKATKVFDESKIAAYEPLKVNQDKSEEKASEEPMAAEVTGDKPDAFTSVAVVGDAKPLETSDEKGNEPKASAAIETNTSEEPNATEA